MLLNFTVSNFLSFLEPTTFSMEAGRARGKREHVEVTRQARTLKFAAIYGANASGKSNFFQALEFASDVIVIQGKIPSGYTASYNRVSQENISKASTFEFEILLNKKRFIYGFSIILSTLTFSGEWLYDNTREKTLIFSRSFDDKTTLALPVKGDIEKRIHIYFDDVKDDPGALFLQEMNRKKAELYKESKQIAFFRDIFKWFSTKLVFIYPRVDTRRYSYTFNANKAELFSRLETFGLDITDYKYESTSIDTILGQVPEDLRDEILSDIEQALAKGKRDNGDGFNGLTIFDRHDLYSIFQNDEGELAAEVIKLQHGQYGDFLLSEESDGTCRILELVEVLLSNTPDVTYIIDEIDRSMHPLLTDAFISDYLSQVGDRKTQLIVTTHETRLLNTNRLRRDEIWFVDKREGITDMWRFDHMADTEQTGTLARGDIKIETAYLTGRYGAIPNLLSYTDGDNL